MAGEGALELILETQATAKKKKLGEKEPELRTTVS